MCERVPSASVSKYTHRESKNMKQEVLLQISTCSVHLMDEGEALQLANGKFMLVRLLDKGVSVATVIKVGDDLRWPLTKDEPVVKLDPLHYLFSMPMKDGDSLSFGITFEQQHSSSLALLDSFLREHSCFSTVTITKSNCIEWKQFAPRVEDYNNFQAKAIAGVTGQIVKGIFICSNSYSNQVCSGAEMLLTRASVDKSCVKAIDDKKSSIDAENSRISKSLKRVRNLSKMTENLSKATLDGIGVATGSVMAPLVKSQPGKSILSTTPGEVLLVSLDAINRIMDAVEVAEKQALYATSNATTKIVTNRLGENAGEATEDVLATAGHAVNTAWNVLRIRKAITPASTVSMGVLKNAKRTENVQIPNT